MTLAQESVPRHVKIWKPGLGAGHMSGSRRGGMSTASTGLNTYRMIPITSIAACDGLF